MSTSILVQAFAASRTVRFRTTAGIAVVACIALVLAAWVGLVAHQRTLIANLDESIGARMEPMIEEWKAGGIDRRIPGFEENGFAQLVREDGSVVSASGKNLASSAGGTTLVLDAVTAEARQIADELSTKKPR